MSRPSPPFQMSGRPSLDDVFLAMWTFYLSYSEAGFRSGYLDVCQLTLVKDQ